MLGRNAVRDFKRESKSINYRCGLHDSFCLSHLLSLSPTSSLNRQESLLGSEVKDMKVVRNLDPVAREVHVIILMDR